MTRRRSPRAGEGTSPDRLDAHWIVTPTLTINRRLVERGTEVKISGQSGRYAFLRHVLNPANNAEWIDVYGGATGAETIRSFRPGRISTVHRLRKARP